HQEADQPGHLPNRLDQPNLGGIDAQLLDGEIVEDGLPDAKAHHHEQVVGEDGEQSRTAAAHGASYQRVSSAAISAARSGRLATTTYSSRLWAPSPTAPSPSSVGMVSAAVKLASEAPPEPAGSSESPSSAPMACARRKGSSV